MSEFNIEGLDRLQREADQNMAKAREMRERLAEVVGKGEAADGRIRAEFNSREGLSAFELDPRVLRMPAHQLSQEIKNAVNAASANYREQTSAVAGEFFGIDASELTSDSSAAIAKVQQLSKASAEKLGNAFADQMKELLRELSVQQQRAQEAMKRSRDLGAGP